MTNICSLLSEKFTLSLSKYNQLCPPFGSLKVGTSTREEVRSSLLALFLFLSTFRQRHLHEDATKRKRDTVFPFALSEAIRSLVKGFSCHNSLTLAKSKNRQPRSSKIRES